MRSMTVFNYLLEATVFGSVLILLVIAVRALLRHRLGNRAIYAAWLLVALRLLLPITLPNPMMDEFRPGLSIDTGARSVADQVRQRVIDAGYEASQLLGQTGDDPMAGLARQTSLGFTGKWFLIGWLTVCLLVAAWLFWKRLRFCRQARQNRVHPLEGRPLEDYQALCRRYKVKPVPVYFVDRQTASSVIGIVHPFIALPLSTPQVHIPLVLAHEICHRKSWDNVWGIVRILCCAAHWFNPLVWLAAWLSWADSEMACDDRVTARLQDMDRLAYVNAIVSAAERQDAGAAGVGASFTSKHLRRRVTSIIHGVRGSRWAVAIGSLLAAGVLVFSFATSESEPLPTISAVPGVTWSAAATPLTSEAEAVACARRFLESEFIQTDTTGGDFAVQEEDTQWQVTLTPANDGKPMLLRYSKDGYLLEYDGRGALSGYVFQDESYTHHALTSSVDEYLTAFMSAQLPGRSWERGAVISDARAQDVRVLAVLLRNDAGETVCDLSLQVEPVVRILYCHPHVSDQSNG